MFVLASVLCLALAIGLARLSVSWGQTEVLESCDLLMVACDEADPYEPKSVFFPCTDGLTRLIRIVEWQPNCVVLSRKGRTWVVSRHKVERLLCK